MREQANYDVQVVSLANAILPSAKEAVVLDIGSNARGLYLNRLAVVASVLVRIGRNGKDFTLRVGQGIEAVPNGPDLTSGVYVNQAVAGGAGAEAEFVITKPDMDASARGAAFRMVKHN